MTSQYVLKDNEGNSGQSLPITNGESRIVNVYLLNADGSPRIITGTISEVFVKIFSTINAQSIHKKLSLETVSLINIAGAVSGMIGFQFSLLTSDTTAMAANNAGRPMIATVTDSDGNVSEFDFASVFNVTPPVVIT